MRSTDNYAGYAHSQSFLKILPLTSPTPSFAKNGEKCPQGQTRSATIIFECADDDSIARVAEPSTCAYEMTVRTPAACSAVS